MLTGRFDRLHSFDFETGELVCEAGVTFQTLMDALPPRGWISPVSLGTAHAAIDGAVANDVHGKTHDRVGSFGHWIGGLDLLTPDGRIRRLGPGAVATDPKADPQTDSAADTALFNATVGGCGLTGVMLKVCPRLMRIGSSDLMVRRLRVRDLDDFLEKPPEARLSHPFSVGWIMTIVRAVPDRMAKKTGIQVPPDTARIGRGNGILTTFRA